MQLWEPESHVSVLTPSGLTLGRYEVFPIRDWKRSVDTHGGLRTLLQASHGIDPPSAGVLRAVEAFFVHDPVEAFVAACGGPEEAREVSLERDSC